MMKTTTIILSLLLLVSGMVYSQETEKGDKEIQVLGSLSAQEGYTSLTTTLVYGYYVSSNLEIGVGPSISYRSYEGSEPQTDFSAVFFSRYYFNTTGKTVPYLAAQWYQSDFSPEEPYTLTDYSFVQAGGGLKFFINEFVAYDVSGSYGFGLGEVGGGNFLVMTGVSVFF